MAEMTGGMTLALDKVPEVDLERLPEMGLDKLPDDTSISSSEQSEETRERSLFHEQIMRFLSSFNGHFIIVIFLSKEIALSLNESDNSRFEFLDTYIYLASILFLCFVFTFAESDKKHSNKKPSLLEKVHILCRVKAEHQHGSTFFLSGIFLFGITTMVFSGIQVAKNLQLLLLHDPCEGPVVTSFVNPILNLLYTFMQMYFIFTNAGSNFVTKKSLMRLGLTHIISNNICVFMSALLSSTIHTIDAVSKSQENKPETADGNATCQQTYLMNIEKNLSHYLLPAVIEFGILSMYVLFSMRKHVGVVPDYSIKIHTREYFTKKNTAGSKKGGFFGLIIFVIALINTIILLMTDKDTSYQEYQIEVPQIIVLLLCIIFTFVGFFKIQRLDIVKRDETNKVEGNLILRVALCGSYMLAALMMIASFVSHTGVDMALSSLVGILSIVQLTQQIFFMYDITCRRLVIPKNSDPVSRISSHLEHLLFKT